MCGINAMVVGIKRRTFHQHASGGHLNIVRGLARSFYPEHKAGIRMSAFSTRKRHAHLSNAKAAWTGSPEQIPGANREKKKHAHDNRFPNSPSTRGRAAASSESGDEQQKKSRAQAAQTRSQQGRAAAEMESAREDDFVPAKGSRLPRDWCIRGQHVGFRRHNGINLAQKWTDARRTPGSVRASVVVPLETRGRFSKSRKTGSTVACISKSQASPIRHSSARAAGSYRNSMGGPHRSRERRGQSRKKESPIPERFA